MAIQVQLRGGSKDEHRQFIGAEREITVDTSKKTLRVHDGYTYGGSVLATEDMVRSEINTVDNRISSVVDNIAEAHNHDESYISKVGGTASNLRVDNIQLIGRDLVISNKRALVGFSTEDGNYMEINFNNDYGEGVNIRGEVRVPQNLYVKGLRPLLSEHKNNYYGMSTPDTGDTDWIRTTKYGIIPYQSGSSSSVGTSSWRFNEGHYNYLNAHTVNMRKNGNTSSINFDAETNDPGFIRHIENNNVAGMYFSVSDDISRTDAFYFGASPGGQFQNTAWLSADGEAWLRKFLAQDWSYIKVGGKYVYFDGSRPSDAPDGSISFG